MEAQYSSEAVVFISKIQRRLSPEGRSLECNWSCLPSVFLYKARTHSREKRLVASSCPSVRI